MSWNILPGTSGFLVEGETSPLLMPWYTDLPLSNDWSNSVDSDALCGVYLESANISQIKTSVNHFQGLETGILRWFTDDSDFCVSLLLNLLPRELGAYFLPHHGYKKYQQKPQESNCSILLFKKIANELNVSSTREAWVSVRTTSTRHWGARALLTLATNCFAASFLTQGMFCKEPKRPTEILFFHKIQAYVLL